MSDDPTKSQILIYRSEDGRIKLDVRFEGETVWLTQQLMADLFQSTKQNVGQHLKRIFDEGELTEISVVKKFFTTAADGKNYATNRRSRSVITFSLLLVCIQLREPAKARSRCESAEYECSVDS